MTTDTTTPEPRTVVAELREYLEDAARGTEDSLTRLVHESTTAAKSAISQAWQAWISADSAVGYNPEVFRHHAAWRAQILTAAIRRAVVTRWEDGT